MNPRHLLSDIPAALVDEAIDILVESPGVRIERIVSRGHTTAPGSWYDQDRDEWVMVVKGQARIAFEGRPDPVELGPGEHLVIPAHVRHRVVHTDPDQDTVWLAVHYK